MDFDAIKFVNETDPFVDAENLNYMQSGISYSIEAVKNLKTIVDSFDQALEAGDLRGRDGKDGKDGEIGPEGPRGPRGFTGANGENGYIDVDNITDEQLSDLYNKINKFNDQKNWYYSAVLKHELRMPIGDLDLNVNFMLPSPGDDNIVNIGFAVKDLSRSVNISVISSTITTSSSPSSFEVSAFGGSPANSPVDLQSEVTFVEFTPIASGSIFQAELLDGKNGFWYEVRIFGNSAKREVYLNVKKNALQGRIKVE